MHIEENFHSMKKEENRSTEIIFSCSIFYLIKLFSQNKLFVMAFITMEKSVYTGKPLLLRTLQCKTTCLCLWVSHLSLSKLLKNQSNCSKITLALCKILS